MVAALRPIDDIMFEKLMEDADICEEILQVIMDNPKLRIKRETLSGQKSIKIIGRRSVRVDAYTEGLENEIYNIEVQKADNTDHVRRIRYNASAITVSRSEPGDEFKQVQEVYVIYISEFDVLGNGRTISHAEMTCQETGKAVGDGLYEIYVNTANKEESKVSRLMDCFEQPEFDTAEFPHLSAGFGRLKHDSEEVYVMCGKVEEYVAKRQREAVAEALAQAEKEKQEVAAKATVEALREVGCADDHISQILKTKYRLSDNEVTFYLYSQ